MTIKEIRAQFAVGAINGTQYVKFLLDAIRTTESQEEINTIFWHIVAVEENHIKSRNAARTVPRGIAMLCYWDLCQEFRKNKHVPEYLRQAILPQANNRPLPDNLKKYYPPQNDI